MSGIRRISPRRVDEEIPVGARVAYLSVTVFLGELMDSHALELKSFVENNGMMKGKRKFHVNQCYQNAHSWLVDKYSDLSRDYRQFLVDQLDEMADDVKNDIKIMQLSVQQVLNKNMDNEVEARACALASTLVMLAGFYLIKEEEFCQHVAKVLDCYYKKRDAYIANVARHSAMFIDTFKTRDRNIDLNDHDNVKKAWAVLDNKLSHATVNLSNAPLE